MKKNMNVNSTNPSSQSEKNVATADISKTRSSFDKSLKGDTAAKNQSPDRKTEKKNMQEGDKRKGEFRGHEVLMISPFSCNNSLFMCDRISTMHEHRKSGSWHN